MICLQETKTVDPRSVHQAEGGAGLLGIRRVRELERDGFTWAIKGGQCAHG